MIIFEKIRYKNFLSTGDQYTEIALTKHAATLVFGTNGAGKSTLLDALTFGLFGKPYRNINIPQLVNTLNGNNMMVEVEFRIAKTKYLIRRGLKPRTFEIYVNDKMLDQDSKNRDYQVYLEQNILKLNYRSFCQVVVLGSSTFVPFMRLPAADRRFIIEDILDIRIFSIMNSILKQKLGELKTELVDIENKSEITDEKVALQEKYVLNMQDDNKKKIVEYRTSIRENQSNRKEIISDITKIRKDVEKLTKENVKQSKTSKQVVEFETIYEQVETNIKRSEKESAFYQTTENCPTCKQDITESFRNRMIEKKNKKIKDLKDGLKDLERNIKATKIILEKHLKLAETIRGKEKQIQKLNSEISAIDNYILKIQKDIDSIQNSKDNLGEGQKRIESLRQELANLVARKEKLIETKHYLEIVGMMLKDSGIKTKIVKQYLPIINKHVNKYLADLDFFVQFELDETFKESIKSRGRDEFSYESFSEGEKLRIDLALLFTFRDIAKLKNSANTNLLIMDEILDRSLDAIGIDEFMKVMNQLWNNLNIFIISPRGEMFMDKFPATIKFVKQKNFSVIAND